jgi:hypothetical protein
MEFYQGVLGEFLQRVATHAAGTHQLRGYLSPYTSKHATKLGFLSDHHHHHQSHHQSTGFHRVYCGNSNKSIQVSARTPLDQSSCAQPLAPGPVTAATQQSRNSSTRLLWQQPDKGVTPLRGSLPWLWLGQTLAKPNQAHDDMGAHHKNHSYRTTWL